MLYGSKDIGSGKIMGYNINVYSVKINDRAF